MKVVVKSKKKNMPRFNLMLEFILYSVCYTAIFLLVEKMFKTFVINDEHKIIYAFLSIVIIYVLDKLVKPILVTIATPITGLTFGLFYFVINSFILWLTDKIMFDKLDFKSLWILFFISIVLSLFNLLIEKLIIEPIVRKASGK